MAKISKEQRAQNFDTFNKAILEIFTESGWHSITYESLSKKTGVRPSTLQRYYPTAKHFFQPLQGKIIPYLTQRLEFSDEISFMESWEQALENNPEFRWSVNLLLSAAIEGNSSEGAKKPLESLIQIIDEKTNNKGHSFIERAIGLSTLKFLDIK